MHAFNIFVQLFFVNNRKRKFAAVFNILDKKMIVSLLSLMFAFFIYVKT